MLSVSLVPVDLKRWSPQALTKKLQLDSTKRQADDFLHHTEKGIKCAAQL